MHHALFLALVHRPTFYGLAAERQADISNIQAEADPAAQAHAPIFSDLLSKLVKMNCVCRCCRISRQERYNQFLIVKLEIDVVQHRRRWFFSFHRRSMRRCKMPVSRQAQLRTVLPLCRSCRICFCLDGAFLSWFGGCRGSPLPACLLFIHSFYCFF